MGLAAGCARQPFFQPDARPPAARPLPPGADSARELTAGRHYARHGRLYEALVGRHHRPSWAAPVTAPVLNLATAVPGGLTPGTLGGGFNSISLSFRAADGRQYVLRTVDKDPIQVIPGWLRGSFLTNALRDNISATNPYAALAVPPLAAAVGVPGPRPRLFYVRPDDPVFAPDSLRRFRGQLGLLEEKFGRPAPQGAGQPTPPLAVLASGVTFDLTFESPAHRLDQAALLRARLLDAWLGDWDRHTGQWSWAARPESAGVTSYQPVPKDRDMVFYRLDDGLVGWLVGHVLRRPWATFAPRFGRPRWLTHNARYLDARGLNQLSQQQFQGAARLMQQQLPDSLLVRALRRLPPAVQALEGPRLLAALQARRAALPAFAAEFYRHLARRPVVGGTAQAERFEVVRYADSTVVTVHSLPPSGAARPPALLFRRSFSPTQTRLIQLEGLGGNDVFILKNAAGAAASRPRLRVYGGPGDDQLPGPMPVRGVRAYQGSAPAERAYDYVSED